MSVVVAQRAGESAVPSERNAQVNRKAVAGVLLLMLAGCDRDSSKRGSPPAAPEAPAPPAAPAAPAAPQAPAAPKPPPSAATADPNSPEAAVDVVGQFANLLKAKRYAEAHRLWSGDTRSDADFAKRFAGYEFEGVAVGKPGRMEGAAGSIYIEVPLQLFIANGDYTGSLTGKMTLRRVNDVPGSTADQRRWHIVKADLRPAD
jgi:nucleoid-associated protein YgaU